MDKNLLKQAIMNKLAPLPTLPKPKVKGIKPVSADLSKLPSAPKIPSGVKAAGGLVQEKLRKMADINSFIRMKLR